MKVVALVSGGKDSCYAMMRCIDFGHQIVALANLMPADDSVDELDSYMYQTVGHQLVASYAECMGLPLFRRRIQGSTRHQDLNYKMTPGDEVEDMFLLLREVKQQIPSISAICSGAIASDYQRLRVESVCSRLGLVSFAYLWKQDQTFLLEDMIKRGIVAKTIKVAAMGLEPAKHLGRELAELFSYLIHMKELYGLNVCGEGGEYESLTLDCPLFENARIILDKFQVILHSPDTIASVGILHPLAFHLESKKVLSSSNYSSHISSEKQGHVYEVQGDFVSNVVAESEDMSLESNTSVATKLCLSVSRNRTDIFSISCWVHNDSTASPCGSIQEDLSDVLRQIEIQLHKDGFDWLDVLYIHLYISSMKDFAIANDVYVRFITEKKCLLGVPSRSTIELPLLQVGLGNSYVEVLVANDRSKKVLHVQSISCWAPSCIGPYSQATLHKDLLYMAGQLGLDPPTMTISAGGAAIEMKQALVNAEAIANSFGVYLSFSTVLFVIYCAATLNFEEKAEIQKSLKGFTSDVPDSQNVKKVSDPLSLYILAPALPRGALVEVKPVLQIPECEQDEDGAILPQPSRSRVANIWNFQEREWHHSCYSTCVSGKICAALASITENAVANISLEADRSIISDYSIRAIAKFCIFIVDKILLENNFLWEDLLHLKVYYTTKLSPTADIVQLAFDDSFSEFFKVNESIESGREPSYSLLPVSGSGRSPLMEDIVTCELLASKLQ